MNIMKINKLRTFVVGLVIAAVAITQYGCEQEWQKQHDPAVLKAPATAELLVNTILDSTAILNYTQSVVGQLYVVVLPGNDETVAPVANSILRLNAAGAVFTKQLFLIEDADRTGNLKITGLKQNTEYKVFVLPVNTDGVLGAVTTTPAFKTSDVYKPKFVSSSPAVAATGQAENFKVTLTFDEPVVINKADGIYFRYLNIVTMEITNAPAVVKVDGSKLIVEQTHKPIFGQWVFLTIDADAIKDRANNFYVGISSGLTGGLLSGLYWRVKFTPEVAADTLPKVGKPVADLNFKVVLTFGLTMDFNRTSAGAVSYTASNIVMSYKSGGTTTFIDVPQANVVFASNVVTITPPRLPAYGETVSIQIKENAFRTRYGSPVKATDLSWLISYGYARTLILGNYIMGNLVSHWDGPITDEFPLNITAHATVANKVLINGLLGSTKPIEATFNGDFATLTILGGQTLSTGAPIAGETMEIWNGYKTDGSTVAFIQADGSINFNSPNGFGFYLLVANGWWDLYPAAKWRKATKSGAQPNYVEKFRPASGKFVK
jgi:hypothetical protein